MEVLLVCGLSFVLVLVAASASAVGGGDRPVGRAFASRSVVRAPRGAAATSHPLATTAAIEVLQAGGSAVDAAIAANAVLGVVEPTGAGIGGDLFALVWDEAAGRLHGLDASGRAPRALELDHLRALAGSEIPPFGPLSVTVPGCVDGWATLHERFGRLPWARLLARAADYAEAGFPVSDVIAWHWRRGTAVLAEHPGFLETFAPGGRAPRAGARFRNPALHATLETIARDGAEAFYRGAIARRIDAFARRVGCFLRAEDLAAHDSRWVDPVSVSYRGVRVWQLPPATQGLAVLQMLQLLETVDLRGMGFGSPDHLHHVIEAKKLAFEDRARFYADPEFADVPIEALLASDRVARRRRRLDPRRATRRIPPDDPRLGAADTVYLAVGDAEGNLVSWIQSNFRGFGSGLCPDGLGFCLQDRGELFALDPSHANVYAPGKRPFHTIVPGFATVDDRPWLAFGVMGGDMQPQGQVQVLLNLLDFDMDLQEAGDAPRVYHGGSSTPKGQDMVDGGWVALESGFPPETVRGLAERLHAIRHAPGVFGGYQAVAWDGEAEAWAAASESRKDGHAAGF